MADGKTRMAVEQIPLYRAFQGEKIVEEELAETMFFYEMIAEFNSEIKKELRELFIEANELLSIVVASINTVNSNIIKDSAGKIRNPKSKI